MAQKLLPVRPIIGLLDQLDVAEIPYVSWKNNHVLDSALDSERDVDLFIPIEHRAHFMMLRAQDGWLCVENPIARYPWIVHLYKPDEDQHVFHLHVYFRVITGESWLKEYLLPLDNFLIENRVRSSSSNIWILSDKAQAYLFSIRHLLKCSSFSSRLLYYREFDSYRKEWIACTQVSGIIADDGPIQIPSDSASTGLIVQNLAMPEILVSLRFRLSMQPLLRIPQASLPFRRIYSFLIRAMNRYFFKRKKILISGGIIIAVSGVDGAGKSTMLDEAYGFFSRFLTVRKLNLGRPQSRLVEKFRRAIFSNARTDPHQRLNITDRSSVRRAASAMILALLRLKTARKAVDLSGRGYLVLADRWPTDQMHKMDGPRIFADMQSGIFQRICARIERWAYASMPRADVCIFLKLPMEMAVARNRSRIKDDKEADDEIMARYYQNEQYTPLALKVVSFDNSGELEIMKRLFLALMWKEVLAH